MTLRARLVVGFASVLLAAAGVFWGARGWSLAAEDALARAQRTEVALRQLVDVSPRVGALEVEKARAAAGSSPGAVEAVRRARDAVDQSLADLRLSVQERPEAVASVDRVERALDRWGREVAEPELAKPDTRARAAVGLAAASEGLRALGRSEEEALAASLADLRAARARVEWYGAGGLLLVAAIGAPLVLGVAFSLGRRLQEVASVLSRVAGGDVRGLQIAKRADDEVGAVERETARPASESSCASVSRAACGRSAFGASRTTTACSGMPPRASRSGGSSPTASPTTRRTSSASATSSSSWPNWRGARGSSAPRRFASCRRAVRQARRPTASPRRSPGPYRRTASTW